MKKVQMPKVQMPKEFEEQFIKWMEEDMLSEDAKKNKEAYDRYLKVIKLTQKLFGSENVTFTNKNEKTKSHIIRIESELDYNFELRELLVFSKIIRMADAIIIGYTGGGKNSISLFIDGVYFE